MTLNFKVILRERRQKKLGPLSGCWPLRGVGEGVCHSPVTTCPKFQFQNFKISINLENEGKRNGLK